MTNTELIKIREDKNLSKADFAKSLGITAMILGRYEKGSLAIPDSIVEKLNAMAAAEIEVKKTVRKGGRKTKEAASKIAADVKDVVKDKATAEEIEVKKNTRKAGRKAKEVVNKIKDAFSKPNIVVQSPMGGYISVEDIAKKVPGNATDVYVRVDENKLYYVLDDGETGDIDIWE